MIVWLPTLCAWLAGALGVLACRQVSARPSWGAAVFLVVFIGDVIAVSVPPLPAGILVYPSDLVSILLGGIGLWRLLLRRPVTVSSALVLLLMALLGISLLRGMIAYGVKPAGNESRPLVAVMAAIAYFSSFSLSLEQRPRVLRFAIASALVLIGVAVFRWAATAAHLPIIEQWSDVVGSKIYRVLNAASALWLLEMGVLTLLLRHALYRHYRLIGGLLIGTALVMQHRTVWVASLVMIATLAVVYHRQIRVLWVGLAVMAIGLGLLASSLRQQEPVHTDMLSATNTETLSWRIKGYTALLQQTSESTAIDVVLGHPLGSGYTRIIDHHVVKDSPHDIYLQLFLRIGFIGLIAFIVLHVTILSQAVRSLMRPPERPLAAAIITLEAGLLTYSIGYGLAPEQGLLMGLAIALVRAGYTHPFAAESATVAHRSATSVEHTAAVDQTAA